MKRKTFYGSLICLLFVLCTQCAHAQTDYAARWKKVEQFRKQGLDSSAGQQILSIIKLAKKEGNTGECIKAFCLYRAAVRIRDEEAFRNDIIFFEQEARAATFPLKPILHSMLGDLYWNYYQQNRWQILDRTAMQRTASLPDGSNEPDSTYVGKLKKEVETWPADQFFETIQQHYLQSLYEAEKSMLYPVTRLSTILTPGKNTETLRPTLYDFLVHRALEYFTLDEQELTRPSYEFVINDPVAYAGVTAFIAHSFRTADSSSKQFRALQLYQQLLAFHSHDADASALLDADLARVRFVHRHCTAENKNDLYVQAMHRIEAFNPGNQQIAMARYYIAEYYTQDNQQKGLHDYYQESSLTREIDLVTARKWALAIESDYPGSEAAAKAGVLLQQIERHDLQLNTEKVVLPGRPSLAKVFFKNVPTAYAKIVKLSMDEFKQLRYEYNNDYSSVTNRAALKQWAVQLPDKGDFLMHTTEIKIEALPVGVYAFVLSEDKEFKNTSYSSVSLMSVSNLAYVYTSNDLEEGTNLFVVHRESGQALPGVTVKTSTYTYDYTNRKPIEKAGPEYKTDGNGMVRLKRGLFQAAYFIELISGNDDLYMNDNVYVNEVYPRPKEQFRTFFFTDRSIYRPGQTIFFKGIMVRSFGDGLKQHELLTQRQAKVYLRDANNQVVSELAFTSNDYGAFSGSFQAPEGLLNGRFQIVGDYGSADIQVEEYKRPTFDVVIDTLKTSYRLGDTLRIKGHATAYAGNAIDGARVSYRVVREARFPYYWCFYRWGQPASPARVMTHGVSTSNSKGEFEVSFAAMPDQSIDENTMPVFDYRIEADVTDVNGETRHGDLTLSASYRSLILQIDVDEKMAWQQFTKLSIKSTNLSGGATPATVTLNCIKLQTPVRTLRSRLWDKVDTVSIPEAQFRRDFPFDEYKGENDYRQWKEEKQVWSKTVNTGIDDVVALPAMKPEPGYYLLLAKTKDAFGSEVVEKKFVRLYDANAVKALGGEHLLVAKLDTRAGPGEKAQIAYASADEPVHILYQSERNGKCPVQWLKPGTSLHMEYPVSESDRGGFYVTMLFVKQNRMYRSTEFIDVPWTNKQLTVSLETFRDKMLPGSKQEWKIRISGQQKERVGAELLATMYDASLDAFRPHELKQPDLHRNQWIHSQWNSSINFVVESGRQFFYGKFRTVKPYEKRYQRLNWFGLLPEEGLFQVMHLRGGLKMLSKSAVADESKDMESLSPRAAVREDLDAAGKDDDLSTVPKQGSASSFMLSTFKARSDFSETAFFYPDLHTDQEGNILLSFTMPDALTKWKLLAFAHTTDLSGGLLSAISQTQKEIMVVPNTPRFFREGDHMTYSAKVSNTSQQALQGKAILQLRNAITNDAVDDRFENKSMEKAFSTPAGGSVSLNWNISIPDGFTDPLMLKVVAAAGDYSDGEQNVVPVLSNRMLLTETMPLAVRSNSDRTFSFSKLLHSDTSSTLRHHQLTLEYTTNPAWYAVQALSYLNYSTYDCSEQRFNRFYANMLAMHIAASSPALRQVFDEWLKDSTALRSKLEKNRELKNALLQETPWVLDARNQQEQQREIASLFDTGRMQHELDRSIHDLSGLQTPNGGFSWFAGMPDDRYLTQYILTGIGKLIHLGVDHKTASPAMVNIADKAMPYLDERLKEDFLELKKRNTKPDTYRASEIYIQYLYMRSFFREKEIPIDTRPAYNFYKTQAIAHWTELKPYMKGMLALALYRDGDRSTAAAMIRSLREQAIRSDEMGMYWKQDHSYWWYDAPTEMQALLIEAFSEIAMQPEEIDAMKIWLLKNKQTQHWHTTKATADACYALLLNGSYWLGAQPRVDVTLGDHIVRSSDQQQEAGTGYFKTSFQAAGIQSGMGNIRVKVASEKGSTGSGVSSTTWGAVYWQYFEQLDKITPAETPLQLTKKLWIERNTDKGPLLVPISDKDVLEVGDKVNVRIELRVDRPMEYVHLKDMRAACFEPLNVISQYTWQGGLGYYETTKDACSSFFFYWLPKGTYVFEYPMMVTHRGDFSNGVASIQCMYAPEFSSHTEGLRVTVK